MAQVIDIDTDVSGVGTSGGGQESSTYERYRLIPNSDTHWTPYERQWTETSLHPCLSKMPRSLYKLRWMAWYPLQRRMFWGTYTLGEALLLTALLAALGVGAYYSWHDIFISGQVAAIPLFLSFTLACRNSIWTFLLGLPYERSLFWHKVMAGCAVVLGAYHGLLSWYFGHEGSYREGAEAALLEHQKSLIDIPDKYVGDWKLSVTDHHLVIGWLLELSMLLMVLTSIIPQVRRLVFERWLFVHFALIIATLVFSYIHNIQMLAIGLGLYLLDLVLRYGWMAGIRNPKKVEMVALPGDVVRVAWPKKDFEYMGGQYVFLCIPELSWYEWHPFSLSSCPDNEMVYLHIRVLGDWTRALHTLAMCKSQCSEGSKELKTTTAYIEGPYGSPSLDLAGERHTMFLLISGGIGVTPMQSVLNDLLSQQKRGRPLKLVWFLWSVRDKHMMTAIMEHDKEYAEKHLPNTLPGSFSPDLVSQHQRMIGSVRMPHAVEDGAKDAVQRMEEGGGRQVDEVHVQEMVQRMEEGGGRQVDEVDMQEGMYDDDFLHTEFYLTNTPEASQPAAQGRMSDGQSCVCTGLQESTSRDKVPKDGPGKTSTVHYGRPDLSATLLEAARLASQRSPIKPRLAVMVCGPPSMTQEVEFMSHKLNGSYGVSFDFHKELFDM